MGVRVCALLAMVGGCAQPTAPSPEGDARPSAGNATGGVPPAGSSSAAAPTVDVSAVPPVDPSVASGAAGSAAPSATAAPTTSASAPPDDGKKTNAPEASDGPALQARAKALFDGVVANDPKIAEPFWFPREPFTRLKAIDRPEKYWEQLHRTYEADVHKLHRSRKSWEGARFVAYEQGSKPTWVKPGEEGNSIGYWRSFRGKVRFEQDGKQDSFEVRVTITWQGAWHITHLLPFKK